MKHTIILTLFFCLVLAGYSQDENQAIGIRGGVTSGFEYRVFTDDESSYRLLLSARKQGLQLTALREFHIPDIFDIGEDISLIYGFGAHAGFESWHVYYNEPYYPYLRYGEKRTGLLAGLDGLAGLEYRIPTLPLVAGLEVKPYFNLFGENFIELRPLDIAFTLKYVW